MKYIQTELQIKFLSSLKKDVFLSLSHQAFGDTFKIFKHL